MRGASGVVHKHLTVVYAKCLIACAMSSNKGRRMLLNAFFEVFVYAVYWLAETRGWCQTQRNDGALIAGSATAARPATTRWPPLIADLAGSGR